VGAFLSGLMSAVGPKIEEKHQQDLVLKAKQKQSEFDTYWGSMQTAATRLSQLKSKDQLTPQEEQEANKLAQQYAWSEQQLGKLTKSNKPLSEAVQKVGGFVKQILSRPSPKGRLQPPQGQQQAQQPDAQSQPQGQQQGSGPLQPPQPQGAQPQQPAQTTQPKSGPLQPPAPAQKPSQPQGSMMGAMALAAGPDKDAIKDDRERAMKKYEKELELANHTKEEAAKQEQAIQQQKSEDDAMEKYAATLPKDEGDTLRKAHYNKRFTGSTELKTPATEKKTIVHVKDKDGNWRPAEESPDGKLSDLSGKPIDPSAITDVNKTGAAPEKYTGELKTYMDSMRITATSHDPVEVAAAGKTLKDLELKRQALISQAGSEGTLSDDQLKTLAKYDAITGNRTEISYRDPMMKAKYTAEFANAIKDFGGPEKTSEIAASYKANKANLEQLTKVKGTMEAAKNATDKEIDRAIALGKSVPRSQSKLVNNYEQLIKANLTDYPELARYREALLAARYRYNSMIASFKGAGAATNQIRSETAEEIIDRSMPKGAFEGAAKEMKVGLGNVMQGLDEAISGTKKQLQAPVGPSPKGALLPPASGGSAEDPLGVLK
jgi:hypothetical protein